MFREVCTVIFCPDNVTKPTQLAKSKENIALAMRRIPSIMVDTIAVLRCTKLLFYKGLLQNKKKVA